MENTNTIIENPEAPREITVDLISDTRAQRFLKRIKNFAKTRKGKVVLGVVSVLVIALIVALIFVLSKQPAADEPNIQVSESIASDKIYDNFDFIYNSEDNKLIASSVDRLSQLEIVSGTGKIIDYIISPNKKKIAFSVSDPDYKSKIFSTNADMTLLNFNPVPFKIYELDLETGVNAEIWSVDTYEIGATSQQLYKQKTVIYPDSYAVGVDWWGVPFSYPVSNVQVENDIEAGYSTTHIPYDLQENLQKASIKLFDYNSDGNKIVFASKGKTLIFDGTNSTVEQLVFPGDITNNCYSISGDWVSSIVVFDLICNYEYSQRRFVIDGLNLTEIDSTLTIGGPLIAVLTKPEYTLVTMRSKQYPPDFTPSLNMLDFTTRSVNNVKDLTEHENLVSVETVGSDIDVFASKIPIEGSSVGYYGWTEATYVFYKYNKSGNTIEKLSEFILPIDIYNLSYNLSNETFSYYRTYRASTESIIEYRIVNLTTFEETELLTIKVDNDSVLYYKPKLVWLDTE